MACLEQPARHWRAHDPSSNPRNFHFCHPWKKQRGDQREPPCDGRDQFILIICLSFSMLQAKPEKEEMVT